MSAGSLEPYEGSARTNSLPLGSGGAVQYSAYSAYPSEQFCFSLNSLVREQSRLHFSPGGRCAQTIDACRSRDDTSKPSALQHVGSLALALKSLKDHGVIVGSELDHFDGDGFAKHRIASFVNAG